MFVEEVTIPFVFQWPESIEDAKFENLGYTLEVIPKDVEQAGGIVYKEKLFGLKQFHLHFASEHRLNGHAWPLEIHFVHKAADAELLVVGLWFEFTKNDDGATNGAGWLDFINDHTPEIQGEEVDIPHVWIVGAQRAIETAGGFYNYKGSLTTPPCTEGVNWWVALADRRGFECWLINPCSFQVRRQAARRLYRGPVLEDPQEREFCHPAIHEQH